MAHRSRLDQLGLDAGQLTDEQRAVLESLSDAELALLVEIRRRLDDGDDVEGHAVDGGGLVW